MASNLKRIKEEIDSTQSIELITEALGDIATAKLKKTRSSIQHTIYYFQEISMLYRTVKSIYLRSKPPRKLPQRKTNGRTVSILLSANSGLYGGLDAEITKFFASNNQKLNSDFIVIGKFGDDLLRVFSFNRQYQRIFFKKDSPSLEELQNLAQLVFYHERILVYYSKFDTLLSQKPFISDISTSYLENYNQQKAPFHFILEPEVGKILSFFDSQVTFLLLQSIFLEVDLSRLAARMVAMNQAQENAEKILNTQKKQLLKARKDLLNLRILENFNSMMSRKVS